MFNMQAFHKSLSISTTSKNKDTYLDALSAITKIRLDQLSVMGNDLSWDEWGPASTIEPVKA